MNKVLDKLDIDISINTDYLLLESDTVLKIKIKNIGTIDIENALLKIFLDTENILILDNRFKKCISDFGILGSLCPNEEVYVDIPIKLVNIPNDNKCNISCLINYHIIEQEEIIDKNYSSKEFNFETLQIHLLAKEDFNILCNKKLYYLDENINCSFKVFNSGKNDIITLKISEFITDDLYVIKDSIKSNTNNLILDNNCIIMSNLKVNQEVIINFTLKLKDYKYNDYVVISPQIEYTEKNKQILKLNLDELKISFDKSPLLSKECFIHRINKDVSMKNEIINHEIYIKNNTEKYLNNLILTNTISPKIEFIKNSILVNDVYRIEENIYNNIKLGDLEPNEEVLISFKTKCTENIQVINILSSIQYEFGKRIFTECSNECVLNVKGAYFDKDTFIKKQDKSTYYLNDIINFEIYIRNTGNLTAYNVVLTDVLPLNIQYVNNSLYINDVLYVDSSIKDGILLEPIQPNKNYIIKYQAKAIKTGSNIVSNSSLSYTLENKDSFNIKSNTIEMIILGSKIGENSFVKEVSHDSIQVGDLITNNLIIENTGNIDCDNLKIVDYIIPEIEFIENSLKINNKVLDNANIFNGITIDELLVGDCINITYKTKVISYPKQNPINSRCKLSYSCIENGLIKTNEIYSSRNKIYINNPILSVYDNNSTYSESSIEKYICKDEAIFYNLHFKNEGNVGLENIKINLNLPEEVILVRDSIKLNNHLYNNYIDGIIVVPNLNVSQNIYLNFYAKYVGSTFKPLESNSLIEYEFKDLKSKNTHKRYKKLKESILIVHPSLEVNQFISNTELEVDEEFTKTIIIKNNGNIELNNIRFDLYNNEYLNQIENSVFINGKLYDNQSTISINKIKINESIAISVRYKLLNSLDFKINLEKIVVKANYLFKNSTKIVTSEYLSNEISIFIKKYDLKLSSTFDNKIISINEPYNYILNVKNNGNIDSDNILLNLNLPNEISIMDNMIYLNSTSMLYSNLKKEYSLGPLKSNKSLTISFKFKISDCPYNNKLLFDVLVKSIYKSSDDFNKEKEYIVSELLDVEYILLDILKSASHDYLQIGDILQIQTLIRNIGNTNIQSLFIKDNKEKNLVFIKNSVCIDGEYLEELNPIDGFKLDGLHPDESKFISYDYEYIPKVCNKKITHFSDIQYDYITKGFNKANNGVCKSPKIYIEGALSTFKQFNLDKEYILNDFEPDIYELLNVYCDTRIDNFYEIDTIKNKSLDNFNSTGKKVILKGVLIDKIEYCTHGSTSSLYFLTKEQPFTISITLPTDSIDENIYFNSKCDEVYFKSLGKRRFFLSRLISIEGSV